MMIPLAFESESERAMASILTNISAMAALQTLRAVSSSLGETQGRVSSGLRVGAASDNAAYWSIATTMRSDNTALSAVSDALGLAAAKMDVAYVATISIVDLLTTFKSRLVTAQEAGVDRSKIQEELEQLKDQAVSIVDGASFNGVNYLKAEEIGSLLDLDELKTSVVSSFVRATDGGVSVTKTNIDLKATTMLNVGGGGILQKELTADYPDLQPLAIVSYFHEGHEDHTFIGPVTFSPTDSITFNLVLDRSPVASGNTYPITINKALVDAALGSTDGIVADAFDVRKILQKAFDDAGAPADAYRGGDTHPTIYDVATRELTGHVGSSIYFEDLTSTLPGANVLGLDSSSSINHDNMCTEGATIFTKPFTMPKDLLISFDFQIGGGGVQTISIDRDTVISALGNASARVETPSDFAAVVAYASSGTGLALDVVGSEIFFFADQALYPGYGNDAVDFSVSDFRTNKSWSLRFDLAEIDITKQEFTISEYLDGVEYMLQRTVSSATSIGSIQSRIDMQLEFTHKLSDNIHRGVGRLVDADMNEESSRLKALQTQEQLAIQSLSIANTNADAIVQLFR